MNSKKGIKLVISGPSGSGKGTIVQQLIQTERYALSVSATTRSPRSGEIDGVHYFFKTKEEFEEMIQNEGLLEWAEFCENYYGTPKFYVEQKINEGKDVILEIEVQGAQKIKELYPDAVFIFVVPPSLTELKHRLEGRGTEAQEVIEKRLKRAEEELELMREYNYVIVNESVEEAVSKINAIVDVEHCKAGRNLDLIEKIKKER